MSFALCMSQMAAAASPKISGSLTQNQRTVITYNMPNKASNIKLWMREHSECKSGKSLDTRVNQEYQTTMSTTTCNSGKMQR